MYDAVIFDNDGVLTTLVDRSVLRGAALETFEHLGVDPDPADVDRMTVGVSPADLRDVCASYDLSPAEFWRVRDETASQAQIDAIHAGEKTLYDDVDAVGRIALPRGIVSSNQQTTLEFLLAHFDIGSWFGTVHGRDPVPESLERKKPATYYLERALTELDVDAERTLFVGDTWVDVVAGEALGCETAFIRRSHRADHALETEPTYELAGLDDLLSLDGVPVRENSR